MGLYTEIKIMFTDYGFKCTSSSVDDDGNKCSMQLERGGIFLDIYLWERDFSKATITVYDKELPNWIRKTPLIIWNISNVSEHKRTILETLFGMIQNKKKGLRTYK